MFDESGEGKGPVNRLLLICNSVSVLESAAVVGIPPDKRLSLRVSVVNRGISVTRVDGRVPVKAFASRAKVCGIGKGCQINGTIRNHRPR